MGFPTVTHSVAYLGTRQPASWQPRGWQTLPVIGHLSCKRRCIGQLARLSLARKGLADPDPQREGGSGGKRLVPAVVLVTQ
jgi:hypothetical protein